MCYAEFCAIVLKISNDCYPYEINMIEILTVNNVQQ